MDDEEMDTQGGGAVIHEGQIECVEDDQRKHNVEKIEYQKILFS